MEVNANKSSRTQKISKHKDFWVFLNILCERRTNDGNIEDLFESFWKDAFSPPLKTVNQFFSCKFETCIIYS